MQTVYGGQIVVTNPTSLAVKLDILVQVPVGAIPVNNGQYTRNVHLQLEPYRTESIEYYFYFPAAGPVSRTFRCMWPKGIPCWLPREPMKFKVVEEPTQIDRQSWQYVSQSGTMKTCCNYLQTQNLQAIPLDRIAFRMGDPEFFRQTTHILSTASRLRPHALVLRHQTQ